MPPQSIGVVANQMRVAILLRHLTSVDPLRFGIRSNDQIAPEVRKSSYLLCVILSVFCVSVVEFSRNYDR